MENSKKLTAGIQLEGSFLGFDTTFYADSNKNVACRINLNDKGLAKFLELFEENTQKTLSKFVEPLGKISEPILVWYDSEGGLLICTDSKENNSFRFILYNGNKGRLLLADCNKTSLKKITKMSDDEASVVAKVLKFFCIEKILLCFKQEMPDGSKLEDILKSKNLSIPKSLTETTDDLILFYTKFDLATMSDGPFKEALQSEIFSTKTLEFYMEFCRGEGSSFYLMFPEIHTSIMDSRNLLLKLSVGNNLRFSMSGEFSFPALNNTGFELDAEFTESHVEFSASSLPGQVFRVPDTHVQLSEIALSFGVSRGLEIGLMAGASIRELSLFGAILFEVPPTGEVPLIELLAVALTELTIPSVFKNILGINDPAINKFNVISIYPFGLNNNEKLKPGEHVTKKQIVDFINKACLSDEFRVSEKTTSFLLKSEEKKYSIRVLDKKRMLHYEIDSDGSLVMSPQFFYASKFVKMGAYTFPKGIFFCGEVRFLGVDIKTMFCLLEEEGLMGFAKISELDCGIIKLTSSTRSEQTENPVTTDSNAMISKLVGKSDVKAAVFFISLCRDKYSMYLDGHLELCGLFGMDTQLIFVDGLISIYAKFMLGDVFSTTIDFAVKYDSILSSAFSFRYIFDTEPLYACLDKFQEYVCHLAIKFKESHKSAEKQLEVARRQVDSLNVQIYSLEASIANSKKRIDDARWWQVWICIEEGAKIAGYEVAIAALVVSKGVAVAALNLALAAVKASSAIGEEVLYAVDLVITGVINAFFIHHLEFKINVNPSNNSKGYKSEIQGTAKLTVLGKKIEGDFNVKLSDLNSVKDLLENQLKKIVGNQFKKGKYIDMDTERKALVIDESLPYSHLLFDEVPEKKMSKIVANAQEGIDKLERGVNMGLELEEFYINEMYDERPEFQSMLNTYKSNANDGSALIGRTIDGVYEPVKALAEMLTNAIEKKKKENDPKVLDSCNGVIDALEKYRKYIEPAMVDVQEIRNRFKSVGDNIDLEKGKEKLRSARSRMRSSLNESDRDQVSCGIQIMKKRDYDRLYKKIGDIVEENFPGREKSNFFSFGKEEKFYKALNNSRKQSGCAYADDTAIKRGMQMLPDDGYRSRL